jgi:hypothetical protein
MRALGARTPARAGTHDSPGVTDPEKVLPKLASTPAE